MEKNEEAKDFINLGIVINKRGDVLMIRRRKKEAGKDGSILEWAFPGGKQRYKESRGACVRREILAETGYDVVVARENVSMRIHPQIPVFIIYHFCGLKSEKPIAEPKEFHEVAEIRWVKKEEIKNLITTDFDKNVARGLGIK